ncbi:uncharacterized protein NPIL_77941 [Nephila pilipes]|uniref:Uncharacterized protein n=1 Tax=Nephila pilipes TaxID=299642 RepID=A0A8X6TJ09_NEPPI|nr:uncharacterized protein NPIL_77941 [Nephila pilipes]
MSVSIQHLMRYHEKGSQFLSRIIAADETRCHHFDPATKIISMEWRHPSSPRPKKPRSSTRADKVMLTCFFEVDDPLLLDWLPADTTVNAPRSPVVLFQEPRRLTTYMAAISRRRRFTILIVICCVSLFIFGWYSKSSNDLLLTKLSENPSSNFVMPDQDLTFTNALKNAEHESESVGVKRPQFVPHPWEPPNGNELLNLLMPDEEEKPFKQFEGEAEFSEPSDFGKVKVTVPHRRHPDLELEFSGPTDYDLPVTMPNRRHPDIEQEFSGPTDYDIPITMPNRRHPDAELEFSGPSEYEDIPVTMPNRRHPDVEMEFSGPTEDSKWGVAKLFTPPMLSNIIENSKINEIVHFPKSSIEGTTPSGLQVTQPPKNPSLILDTSGCKVPKLDPWDPTVKHLIELQDPYICPGPPLFMKPSPHGSIVLNETILEKYYNITAKELECYYQPIYRKHEDPGNVRENDFTNGNVTELQFGVSLNEDYVGASCRISENSSFEQYFPLVRLKKEIEEERSKIAPPTPRLNVILAGIDSVSKLNFLRHFRKTHAFLNEKLTPFEMNGYTKVGDNTFPNLVPMLTGHFVEHYWNESLRDIMYFDDIDLIWKDYAKKGYRTFYAEDSPFTGTFNYIKRGFYDPPTDYYIRPMLLALEYSNLKEKSTTEHCLNSQMETDLIYDYLRDFIKTMGDRPHIAFAMVSTITHDYLNHAGWADEPTVHILEDLLDMGALNNSLFVMFSDHGLRFGKIRYTYIGKFEERMPFMYIHAPKWFLEKYPQIARNLKINQNRLMTLFDIHATMIHLLDLNKTPAERAKQTMGLSLLDEIPENRTCTEANILPHWCPCQTFEDVPLNSSEAVSASQAIVNDINSQLEAYGGICEVLEVGEIMDARVGQANDLVLRFVKHENVVVNRTVIYGDRVNPIADYMITLVTKPGNAVFEGTVRHDPATGNYQVLGISRISLYGTTSWCIDSQKMKIFCYCKIQKES